MTFWVACFFVLVSKIITSLPSVIPRTSQVLLSWTIFIFKDPLGRSLTLDHYDAASKTAGLHLLATTSVLYCPLLDAVEQRGLCLALGAMGSLGIIVGLDQDLMSQWVV